MNTLQMPLAVQKLRMFQRIVLLHYGDHAGLNLIFKVPRTNVPTYSQMYRHRVKLYRHELEEHFTLLELE